MDKNRIPRGQARIRSSDHAVSGSFVAYGASAITTLTGIVRFFVLIRLLVPEDFGTFTLAFFYYSLLATFRHWGLNKALIQKKNPERSFYSTHFVSQIALATGILGMALLLAIFLGTLYSESRISTIVLILVLIESLSAMNSTPIAVLQRELRFGAIAMLDVIGSLSGTILAIAIAAFGGGLWALPGIFLGSLISRTGIVWLILKPWHPAFLWRRKHADELFRFGRPLFVSSTIAAIVNRFDDFWIGTSGGLVQLGYYSRAFEAWNYGSRLCGNPLAETSFPILVRLRNDKERLSRVFEYGSSAVVRLAVLFSGILLTNTDAMIKILFGTSWLPMSGPLQIMLLYLPMTGFYMMASSLTVALGEQKRLMRIDTFQLLVFIPLVVFLFQWYGPDGVATALGFVTILRIGLLIPILNRSVKISWMRIWSIPVVAVILLRVGAQAIWRVADSTDSVLHEALFVTVGYLLTLILVEYRYWKRPVQMLLKQIFEALSINRKTSSKY